VCFLVDICGSAVVLDVVHTGTCNSNSKNAEIQFQWLLLQLDCMEELYMLKTQVISLNHALIRLHTELD